jgi:transposase-like protein
MEEVGEVKEKKGKENRYGRRYGFEIKLRCVKLYLQEGLPLSLLAKEVGASTDGIRRWVKAYQERGEKGLRNTVRSSGSRRKLPGPVRRESGGEPMKEPSGQPNSGSRSVRQKE